VRGSNPLLRSGRGRRAAPGEGPAFRLMPSPPGAAPDARSGREPPRRPPDRAFRASGDVGSASDAASRAPAGPARACAGAENAGDGAGSVTAATFSARGLDGKRRRSSFWRRACRAPRRAWRFLRQRWRILCHPASQHRYPEALPAQAEASQGPVVAHIWPRGAPAGTAVALSNLVEAPIMLALVSHGMSALRRVQREHPANSRALTRALRALPLPLRRRGLHTGAERLSRRERSAAGACRSVANRQAIEASAYRTVTRLRLSSEARSTSLL
jgi:hypothetical protein